MTDDRRDEPPFPPAYDPEAGRPLQDDGAPPPPDDAPAGEGHLPPWEDRAAHSYAGGFFETIRLAMTAPTRLFRGMTVRRGVWGPLSFYVLLYVLMSVVDRLYSVAFSGMTMGLLSFMDELERADAAEMAFMHVFETMGVFVSPVTALITLFISAGLTHLGAMLIIPGQRGFEATLRAVAYGASPAVLGLIPVCGGFVVAPWALVIAIIGMRETHRTTGLRAVMAVLAPLLLAICGCTVSVIVFGMFAAAVGNS
ncbi:MAG TPA: YIP1 family protein [Candidatus Krumholzibacteria bacterium]|nr:YIP1 family protein [Candidatus Krumholzibacteria bacterium]HRX50159.1 YIP1 family protein [Candidatus Krumholzibacteria bacterium]